ncbi:MAG: hypothetical protein ACWGN2_10410, partial [Anaerolineales bacterium]
MQSKPVNFLLNLLFVVAFSIFITACSTPSETETPESSTQVVQATATATTPPPEPTPLPSVEPLPDGLVQIPVPESARETAARLRDAEHPPRDDYRNAEELLGMQPDQLIAEVPDPEVYEVNYSEKFTTSVRPQSDRYKEFTAQVRHISENAVWWKASGSRARDADIIALAERFEEVVIPIDHLAFGREWSPGIDKD